MVVLSCYTVEPVLDARRAGAAGVAASLDLGLSQVHVGLSDEGVALPDGQRLPWPVVDEIAATPGVCFEVCDGQAERVQLYSARLSRFYSLMPTRRAPTMLLSGIPMHRIKEVDPHEDTLRKMRTIAPVTGRVLDTCTGLGYSAIQAATGAGEVLTIELDPTVLDIARRNPWSRGLFGNDRIRQEVGDATDVVAALPAGSFSRIVHDPPTMRIAGDLYSAAMYGELFRVLRRGGRLYHYIGDLDSTSGRVVAKGVVRRLQEAGFCRVTRRPEAFGLTAEK